jgi:chitodextrinase
MTRALGALALQTTDTQPPTIPANVTATAINAGRVDLSWTASTDAFGVAGYQIFRNGAALNTTSGTAYSDTTCQPSTFYSYNIVAFDGSGNSSQQSTAASATTPANAAPVWQSIPTQTLVIGNAYSLNLNNFCTDADLDTITYTVTSGTLPTGLSKSGAIISGTPTISGQSPTITVQAADQFHTISTTISFSTKDADVTAPPVPTGLSATTASSSQINLSWTASTDAAGSANELVSGTKDYKVYRSTDGVTYSLRTTVTTVSYSDTGLAASTQYFYKVSVRDNSLNESAQSSAVNATTNSVSLTAQQDWDNRRLAAGVVAAYGFDMQSDIDFGYIPGDRGTQAFLDTSRCILPGGSMRMTIPHGGSGSDNMSGGWSPANKTNGASTAFGHNFGAGSTLYFQIRMYIESQMYTNQSTYWGASSAGDQNTDWKLVDIYDSAFTPCTTLELTTKGNKLFGGGVFLYTECGDAAPYSVPTNSGASALAGTALCQCGWDLSGTLPSTTKEANCWPDENLNGAPSDWPVNEWFTYYMKVTIGNLNSANSKVEAWTHRVADGFWRKKLGVSGFTFHSGGGTKFDEAFITTYMTGNTKTAPVDASVYYTQMLASTQPIAMPLV